MQIRHQIFTMKDADDVVQNALVHGETRIPGAFDNQKNLIEGRTDFQRSNFHARHHDVFNLALGKLEDAFEHSGAFLLIAVDHGAQLGFSSHSSAAGIPGIDASEEESGNPHASIRDGVEQFHANLDGNHDAETDLF